VVKQESNAEDEALGSQRTVGHPKTTSMVKSDKAIPRLEKRGQQIKKDERRKQRPRREAYDDDGKGTIAFEAHGHKPTRE